MTPAEQIRAALDEARTLARMADPIVEPEFERALAALDALEAEHADKVWLTRETYVSDRLEEIRDRTRGFLPIEKWGPKCNGCGDGEFRIDGYCSVECRNFHSDEDVEFLLAELDAAEARLAREQRAADAESEALTLRYQHAEARLAAHKVEIQAWIDTSKAVGVEVRNLKARLAACEQERDNFEGAWIGMSREAGKVSVRLARAEEALRQIGAAKVLADGDFGHELRARQDIARAYFAGESEA